MKMSVNNDELLRALNLSTGDIAYARRADFPLKITKSLVNKITTADRFDPIVRQFVPQQLEESEVVGFGTDPLHEELKSPVPGLIHKYPDRILLLVTHHCVANCRYCFRQHLRNQVVDWPAVLTYIRKQPQVREVILSGGDPLVLGAAQLTEIFSQLESIPHLVRIRVHTRLPIVSPESVRPNLLQSRLPLIVVVHCNHPVELDQEVAKAIALLRKQTVALFNQSVLLRGVNDQADILIELSEKLFACGILPYYLHMLDPVKGASHFAVEVERAQALHSEMKARLAGYLVPRLIVEQECRKVWL